IEPRFMLHYMRYAVDNSLLPGLVGQTSIAHLTREKLALLDVRHPVSIREQRRTAQILDALDDEIRSVEDSIGKQKLLVDALASASLRDVSLRAGARRMMTVGQILEVAPGGFLQTGPFGSQLHSYDYTPTGIPVVMPQDIFDRSISAENIARIAQK